MTGQPAPAKCFGSFPSALWYSLFGQLKTRALTAALSLCAGFLHSPRLLPACRDGPGALTNTQHPSHATSAAGSDSAKEAAASEGCRRGQHGAGGTCRWLRVEGARIPTQGRAAERAGALAVPPGTRGRRLHRVSDTVGRHWVCICANRPFSGQGLALCSCPGAAAAAGPGGVADKTGKNGERADSAYLLPAISLLVQRQRQPWPCSHRRRAELCPLFPHSPWARLSPDPPPPRSGTWCPCSASRFRLPFPVHSPCQGRP